MAGSSTLRTGSCWSMCPSWLNLWNTFATSVTSGCVPRPARALPGPAAASLLATFATLTNLLTTFATLISQQLGPTSLVLWYDSVTAKGHLAWQNELNHENSRFFRVRCVRQHPGTARYGPS